MSWGGGGGDTAGIRGDGDAAAPLSQGGAEDGEDDEGGRRGRMTRWDGDDEEERDEGG